MTESHPHDLVSNEIERIPKDVLRELSVLSPGRALGAVAAEWVGIAVAVAIFASWPVWWVYLPVLVFIGARQHALTVIGHDAAHYRFLPERAWNDHLGNLLVQWPVFITVEGFRKYHGLHHRFLNAEDDGNRFLWHTHTKAGALTREWTYPKTRLGLLATLARRALFFTGLRWILRGMLASLFIRDGWTWVLVRVAYYGAIAAILTVNGWWAWFGLLWILPYLTWHVAIQYMRLISEHSAITSADPMLADTRTTIPTWWERLLILPRNIGYHIEHHWYPSVPFYNLPRLHAALLKQPRFREHAVISRSIIASMAAVTRPEPADR